MKESKKLICDLKGYRWDAVSLNEARRLAKSEIWETHHKHMYMGAGIYDNKHGIGILLNKNGVRESSILNTSEKHWLMIQNFASLNTMYRKTLGKQTTYKSPEGTEKQIDYILIKRRHLKYKKDAEANDMIHMGSDQR